MTGYRNGEKMKKQKNVKNDKMEKIKKMKIWYLDGTTELTIFNQNGEQISKTTKGKKT